MPVPRRDLWLALSVAVLVFVIHALSPVSQSYDSVWTIHTTLSMLRDGDADLNEYLPELEAAGFYHVECVFPDGSRIRRVHSASECADGRYYHFYPLGVPLITLPFVATMDTVLQPLQPGLGDWADKTLRSRVQRHFLHADLLGASRLTQLLIACVLVAAATALLYLLAREWLPARWAVVLALLFAFAGPAWSTGSRALWMHGFSMLLLTAAFLLLRRGGATSRWPSILSGALLMFAFFVRPTNVVPLGLVALWLLWRHRSRTPWFALGCAPVCLLFAALHLQIYGALLPAYSQVRRAEEAGLSLGPHLPVALAGNLISPSRGLLVYMPVVLFSVVGLWRWWRRREERDWALLLGAIFATHYLLISFYEDWFGGHGYGPRYFADIAPLLCMPLAAFLARPITWRWGAPFVAACAISVFIHSQGAWCQPCMDWAVKPMEIRQSQWRLWQWSDPMFLRGLQPHRGDAALSPEASAPLPEEAAPGQPQ